MSARPYLINFAAYTAIWFSALLVAWLTVSVANTPLIDHAIAIAGFLVGSLMIGLSWFMVAGMIGRALSLTFVALTIASAYGSTAISPQDFSASIGFGIGDGLISVLLGAISMSIASFLHHTTIRQQRYA